MTRYFIVFTAIFVLSISVAMCQRGKLSDVVNDSCKMSQVVFCGVKLKYPLKVLEAKKEYGLEYVSMHTFYKTIDGFPPLSQYEPFNFKLIIPIRDSDPFNDIIPEEVYHDRPVKGYTFLFRGSTTDPDSLRNALEKQFSGKFELKIRKSDYKSLAGYPFYEMRISECVYVAVTNFSLKQSIRVMFYFDMTEEERLWFPL
ncbi:hypothetical protein [Dyadobacter sp. 32]|uniref:hypothetical protein n=1 Tax=Dyadobacter sp. 32 TaxID=538966 RepID=UPI0011EFD644